MFDKIFQSEDKIITDLSVLQQISRKTSFDECDKLNLFNRLRKAASTGWTKALGLTAIQIGIDLSAFYYELDDKATEVVNATVLEKTHPFIATSEGCLSFPNQRIDTQRYKFIAVTGDFRITKKNETQLYLNQKMFLENLEAHIFQHEYDHLVGKIILDNQVIHGTFKRQLPKIGRNDPCPCNSGKKLKHCCIAIYEAQQNTNILESKE